METVFGDWWLLTNDSEKHASPRPQPQGHCNGTLRANTMFLVVFKGSFFKSLTIRFSFRNDHTISSKSVPPGTFLRDVQADNSRWGSNLKNAVDVATTRTLIQAHFTVVAIVLWHNSLFLHVIDNHFQNFFFFCIFTSFWCPARSPSHGCSYDLV